MREREDTIVLNTVVHDGFYGVEVAETPEQVTVSLELLAQPTYGLKIVRDRIVVAGQLFYQITGLNADRTALTAQLVEDRRHD
jgi:hypothetical protein